MKNKNRETWCQNHLANKVLPALLEKIDHEIADTAKQGGCLFCCAPLHCGHYDRKPRGGPQWDKRLSFCCSSRDCRKRLTPPSVRFLGRRVYAGFIVVLLAAMTHGLSSGRVQTLREQIGADRRTLARWRLWWLEHFPKTSFWKGARAYFSSPLDVKRLPWSLCVVFKAWDQKGLLNLLRFLSPLTTRSIPLNHAF